MLASRKSQLNVMWLGSFSLMGKDRKRYITIIAKVLTDRWRIMIGRIFTTKQLKIPLKAKLSKHPDH